MSKRKRNNPGSGGREILLPVPVIQHIQSFLGGKQAARTALVSKSWYDAWLTRPNLYFNQECFDDTGTLNRFWNLVQKIMKRYEESKLNVNSFTLKLDVFINLERPTPKDVHELIKRVLKLCVDGTDFKLKWASKKFFLPMEVLGDERIVRLSVFGGSVRRPKVEEVKFSGLKSISLENLSLHDYFFQETFPCLEDLSIVDCSYAELEISSSSLKRISIVESGNFRGNLNVPNIQKFAFSGLHFPLLSLKKASKEWEAEISVHHLHHRGVSTSWFRSMKSLLKRLHVSMCKVSLSILLSDNKFHHGAGSILIRNKPTVENLMLSLPSKFHNYPGLFDLLFSSCRPKCITQDWIPNSCLEEKTNNKLIKYLWKRLVKDRADFNFVYSKYYTNQSFLHRVNVEVLDDTLGEWKPLQWSTLRNGSKGPENKRKIRFLLKWG